MKKTSRSVFLGVLVIVGFNQFVPTAVGQSFLTNGLVAYYPFNGNANDESGLGKNGTVEGATLAADRFGLLNSAYSFNGIDNRISTVGGTGLPAGMGDFTVSVWAAADQPISGDSRDLVSNGAYNQFSLILGGAGGETNKEIEMYLDHYGPGRQTLFSTNLTWEDEVWYQITVTRLSGLVIIYRNGAPIAAQQFTTSNPTLPGLSDLTIGGRLDVVKVGHPFKGKIDEVRLYDRAFSPSEVQQLYAYESGGPRVYLIKAVKPSFYNLTLTTNYQMQISSDLTTWTNYGPAFTATNATMVYPQYWDVENWNSLFFRLQVVP